MPVIYSISSREELLDFLNSGIDFANNYASFLSKWISWSKDIVDKVREM